MENNNSAPSPSVAQWKDTVEVLAKIGLAFFGLCYVIGLIVTNVHIRRFGSGYMSFLQVEFVSVGLVWLFLVCSVPSTILFGLDQVRPIWKRSRATGWDKIKVLAALGHSLYWFLILPGILLYFVNRFVDDTEGTVEIGTRLYMIGILALNAILFFLVIVAIRDVVRVIMENNSVWSAAREAYHVFFFTIGLLSVIFLYGTQVYPNLSKIFAGGRLVRVKIVVKGDAISSVRKTGIAVSEETGISDTQNLVFENEEYLLLSPSTSDGTDVRGVRLSKNLVESVLYLATGRGNPTTNTNSQPPETP